MINHSDFDSDQSDDAKIKLFSTISDDFSFEIEQYWLKAEHDGQSFGEMTTEYVQWQLVLHYPDSFKIAYINEQFNKDLTTRQSDQQNSSDDKVDVESE